MNLAMTWRLALLQCPGSKVGSDAITKDESYIACIGIEAWAAWFIYICIFWLYFVSIVSLNSGMIRIKSVVHVLFTITLVPEHAVDGIVLTPFPEAEVHCMSKA
jgi:hypothetical protein